MNTDKIEKIPPIVKWLAYHFKEKLPIRVDIPNLPPITGVILGYKEGLLAIKTTTNDALVVNLTQFAMLSSEYMSGVPDPYPGFETNGKKTES